MRIHIGTDHAGLELKQTITARLTGQGHEVVDHGAHTFDPNDDYPGFILATAEGVAKDQSEGAEALGIVLGGSGNGEQIAANKVNGIRAALVWNDTTATLARQHNDANVIAVGARQHDEREVLHLIDLFVGEPFSGDERHVRRIGQIAEYEPTIKRAVQ